MQLPDLLALTMAFIPHRFPRARRSEDGACRHMSTGEAAKGSFQPL